MPTAETRCRTILHTDLDAFFASVEQRDDPSLRGRPVLVGGSKNRGVVAAASYEAREYGIHSAMPMAEALRRCPRAMVIGHHFDRYRDASNQFFSILGDYSPLVESLSLDEAFIDVTESRALFGDGRVIAEAIRRRVRAEVGLVASVGIAPTKFIAKIASDVNKPDGLCEVAPNKVLEFLHPLPLSRLWGVGKVTQAQLRKLGLATIGDVARYPEEALLGRLGDRLGHHLARLARGEDDRDVTSHHRAVSIGHEETFETDKSSREELVPKLLEQADRVASRLRRAELRASVVVLKIKYADFRLVTRRQTLADPTSDGMVIGQVANSLLQGIEVSDRKDKKTKVRLCGVSVSALDGRDAPRQLGLDEAQRARGERLGDAIDAIEDRFGAGLVKRGSGTK